MSSRKSKPLAYYRELLRQRGWTLRAAAPLLGVHFGHLHHVLTGQRHSAALLARIPELPVRNAKEIQNKAQSNNKPD